MCFESYDSRGVIQTNLEIIQMVIKRIDEFKKRLLNDVFLKMEEIYLFNVELNITLLSQNILPIADWDKAIGQLIRSAPGSSIDKVVSFCVNFASFTVVQRQVQTITYEHIPCLVAAMESLSFDSDSQSLSLKQQMDECLSQLKQ